MFDMLGRAKWDAWERQRGYSSQDAKQLYVESMLKVLRRFEDRPLAISLMAELEAYSGDVAEQVMSGTLAETASLHSSSLDHAPSQHAYESAVHDDATEEDEEFPRERHTHEHAPRATSVPHQHALSSSHGTNSGSHETVTVSDMPQRAQPRRSTQAPPPTRRQAAPRTMARRSIRPDDSLLGSERGGAPSYASAQDTRSVHTGPMGRYTASASGRSSVQAGVPPPRALRAHKLAMASQAAQAAQTQVAGAISAQGRPNPSELDQTLRSIQASLSALTERLDRTESRLSHRETKSYTRLFLHHTMAASHATLQDIASFLGLVTRPGDTPAPSYEAWRAHGVPASKPLSFWPLIRSPFKFAMMAAGLAMRILLDLSSLFVLASLLVAALRQVSGRGDPWIALRLLGRVNTRLSVLANAANRRTFVRTLVAGIMLGGVTMESARHITH